MKKLFCYFAMLCCIIATSTFTSCKDFFGLGVEGSPADTIAVHDTVTVLVADTIRINDSIYVDVIKIDSIIVPYHDTIVFIVHDTIYVGPDETKVLTWAFSIHSDKTDNGYNFLDWQPTKATATDEDGYLECEFSTDVFRSATLTSDVDTFFLPKVSDVQISVGRPVTKAPSYDVKGEYDYYTEYRDYPISASDGWSTSGLTEAQSAFVKYNGEKINLLYRMNQGARVVSFYDEMTGDTIVRGRKIYGKVNRSMDVEFKFVDRPLMGPEVITYDTLRLRTDAASETNGIGVVYVEIGDVPEDTIPVLPPDTVPVVPEDTIPVGPEDTIPVGPGDPGYEYDGEQIESIDFSYSIDPNAGILREVLLVRFSSSYVMPVVSKTMLTPVKVANPSYYNSVVWYSNSWTPAYLAIQTEGFVWRLGDNTVGESATDETINWLANTTGISKISRSDFLKHATFVNEGNTTRVYVDNNYYMTLK